MSLNASHNKNRVNERRNMRGDLIRRHPEEQENPLGLTDRSLSRTYAAAGMNSEPSELPSENIRANQLPRTAERRQPDREEDFAIRRIDTSVMRLDLDQTGFDCTVLNNQGDIRINTRADLDDSRHVIEAHQTGIEMTQMTYIHPMDRAAALNVTPLEEERSDDISEEETDSTDSESDNGGAGGQKRIR